MGLSGNVILPNAGITSYSNVASNLKSLFLQGAVDEIVPNNFKYIKVKADFPTPAAGKITLVANTTYIITGNINIGTDNFVIPSGGNLNIIGAAFNNQSITYTGSGVMFENSGGIEFLRIELLTIINTGSGTFSNPTPLVSNPLSQFSVLQCLITGFASIGTWTSRPFISACAFVDNVAGITVNDVIDFRIDDNKMLNSSGLGTTFVTIGGTGISTGSLDKLTIDVLSGETAIDINSGIAATSLVRIAGSAIRGAGTVFDATGIDQEDDRVKASQSEGIPDSMSIGETYLDSTETVTIAVIGTPVIISGSSWVDGELQRFTATNAGRLTYTGRDPITVFVKGQATIEKVGGGSDLLELCLFKNGTILPQPCFGTMSSDPTSVGAAAIVSLVQNDFIELFVRNQTTTANVTVSKALIEAGRT